LSETRHIQKKTFETKNGQRHSVNAVATRAIRRKMFTNAISQTTEIYQFGKSERSLESHSTRWQAILVDKPCQLSTVLATTDKQTHNTQKNLNPKWKTQTDTTKLIGHIDKNLILMVTTTLILAVICSSVA